MSNSVDGSVDNPVGNPVDNPVGTVASSTGSPPGGAGTGNGRDALVSAARAVYEVRGYFQTRVTDITKAAGVAAGSFYTHFPSKDDIFRVVAGELLPPAHAFGSPPASLPEAREWLRAELTAEVSTFVAQRRMWSAVQQAALGGAPGGEVVHERHTTLADRVSTALALWAERGIAHPRGTHRFVAEELLSMTEECVHQWYLLDETPPSTEAAVDRLTWAWERVLRLDEDGTG